MPVTSIFVQYSPFYCGIYMVRLVSLLVFILLSLELGSAQAGARKGWFTLNTDHFQIHSQKGHEVLARRVADIAEAHYPGMTSALGWYPSEKTQIRIVDDYDFSNGSATPIPYDLITMIAFPPDLVNQLEDYDDWLELLFVHEFTHVLHIGQNRGAPAVVQKIVGRTILSFPHLFSPDFLVEGLAVFMETDQTVNVGRGHSSTFEMMMRMEVANGFKPITQVNMDGMSWPYGKSYLYGAFFYNYLVKTYGFDAVKKYLNIYSRSLFPYLLNRAGRRAFGKTFPYLWEEFKFSTIAHFQNQIDAIVQAGPVTGEKITQDLITNSYAKFGKNGLYYVRSNASDHAALMLQNAKGQISKLYEVKSGSYIDPHPKGDVLVAQSAATDKGHVFSDLYLYDKAGNFSQLTYKQRYKRAVWMPDGQHIIALRVQQSQPQFDLLQRDGSLVKTLWSGAVGDVIGLFDISPDGKQLVASRKRDYQRWDLEIFDLSTSSWKRLTQTDEIESAPVFVDEGRNVLFSADYQNKVYDLYKLSLDSGEIKQITRVIGGAFRPDQDESSGEISYLGYGSKGYDLYHLQASETVLAKTDAVITIGEVIANIDSPPEKIQRPDKLLFPANKTMSAYSPWRTLRPRIWMPSLLVTNAVAEVGVSTYSTDASGRHSYLLNLFYEAESGEASGQLQYLWDWPLSGYFSSWLSRENSYSSDEELLNRVRASDRIEISHLRAWTRQDLDWVFDYGLLVEQEKDVYHRDKTIPTYGDFDNALVGFQLTYDDRESYQTAFFLTEGQQLRLRVESNDVIDSDYEGNSYTLTLDKRFPLLENNSISLRIAGGYKDEHTLPYRLSGSNNFFADAGMLGLERHRLRGYSSGRDELRGHKMQLNSLEWYVPFKNIERTWEMFPVGLQRAWSSYFIDSGAAWFAEEEQTYYTSAGLELHAEAGLMGLGSLQFSLGFAHGFDESGENQFYLRVGGDY